MSKRIILASGSPRRTELLHKVGIPHEIIVSNADENVTGNPIEQVEEIAMRKATAVMEGLLDKDDTIVIAADTIVVSGDDILGKPADAAEAFAMLKKLQGANHEVYTGVVLLADGGDTQVFFDVAEVTFHPLSDETINAYIATGEPFDKAGAYGIQEKGAALVDRINGDFYTVMGLPVSKVCIALKELGYDFWHRG